MLHKLWPFLVLMAACASARAVDVDACYNGSAQQGGQRLTTNGIQTSQFAQQSYPLATVTIFDHGTVNISTIFADAGATTPLANPFTASSTGVAFFCAADGRYDVQFSGTGVGITSPFTIADVPLCFTCTGGGGGPGTVTQVNPATGVGAITNLGTFGFSNQTTTPTLTIGLTAAGAHKFWGNNTGSPLAPNYFTLGVGDLPFTYSGNTLVLVTGGTISGTASPLCTDALGNATTVGCPTASGALLVSPSTTQTAQGTAPTVVSLQAECPAGAAATLPCFQILDNTGASILKGQQNDRVVASNYVQALGTNTTLSTVGFSATPVFDLTTGQVFKITLTANVTSSVLTNVPAAGLTGPITFIIIEDSTGLHSFAWPSNVIGGTVINITTPANNEFSQTFNYDGTSFIATAPGVFYP